MLNRLATHFRGIQNQTPRQSFTLVELLVCIAVAAVLLGLLVPHVAQSRMRAAEVKSLANLHTTSQQVQLYTQTYAECYPFARANQDIRITPAEDSHAVTFISFDQVWNLSVYWHGLMHVVAPWRESFSAWVTPGSRRDPITPWDGSGVRSGLPSYELMPAFYARPGVWSQGTMPSPALIAAVRVADVTFPSQKVMMFDVELAYRPTQPDASRAMLFPDGHARALRVRDARPPGINMFTGSSLPLFDTPDGVRGVDY